MTLDGPAATEPWNSDGERAAAPAGRFGRYVIERALGAGGMGVVVAARDPELDRAVAIKFLQRVGDRAEDDLLTEARAMARLTHPNVIAVHEVLRVGDRAGIVMELIDGKTLAEWQASAPRPWTALVDAYVQAARGLAAAHRAQLVHRDFKPSNALIDRDGIVRVTDFGLAETGDATTSGRGGTPAYMAPEVRRGERPDARADQWALARALDEALAGPHRRGPPPPRWIAQALRRAQADAPGDRFPDLDALIAVLAARPPRRRDRALVVGALAIAGAAALAALAARGRDGAIATAGDGGDRAATARTCDEVADAELRARWGPQPRLRFATAFVARGPAGIAAWPAADGALGQQAASWRSARVAACAADRDRAIAPSLAELRRACFARRLDELSALATAAIGPAVDAVGRAEVLALTLIDPALCLDATALARRAPLPDDLSLRPPVAALRARASTATAAAALGQFTEARATLTALIAEAGTLGWMPLVAEVLVDAGLAASGDRDAAAADALLDEGVLAAEAVGHDLATARGLVALVDVRGHGLGRAADGLALVPRARAVLTRLGGAPELASELETHRGRILMDLARYAEAEEVFTAILAERRARAPGRPEVATALINLGDSLVKLGRPADALPHYREAVARRAALFGAAHVLTQRARFSVGNGYLELGDYDGAAEVYRATIAAYEAVYGPTHAILVTPLNNLGLTYRLQGRPAAALPVLERGLALATDAPDPVSRARLETNLGTTLRDLGREAEAVRQLEAALGDYRAGLGPGHPSTLAALRTLVVLERRIGRATSARTRVAAARAELTAAGADRAALDEVDALDDAGRTSGPRGGQPPTNGD